MGSLRRWRIVRLPLVVTAIAVSGCGDNPRRILEEMADAYRAADRYSDDARMTVRLTVAAATTETTRPFRVAFMRPDRVRIDAYEARVAVDGSTLRAAVGEVPGQVLASPVHGPLTLDQVFADDVLRSTLTEGEAGCPTQLALLLADDTLDLILADAVAPPRLVGVGEVQGHACSHVEVATPDGVLGLWIDRRTRLVRRMRLPTAGYAADLSRRSGGPAAAVVDVEFTDASFDAEVPAEAFAFEVPAGAATVARLEPIVPPEPAHPRLGTPAGLPPLATWTDPPAGATTTILDFFFAGCGPAAKSLPRVAAGIAAFVDAHARGHGGERPAIRHVAVSLDPDDASPQSVRRTLAAFGGVGAIARDPRGVLAGSLGVESFPATVIVTPDGRVADVIVGDHDRIAADVAETLAAVQQGRDTVPLVRGRHERRLREHRRAVDGSTGLAATRPPQVIPPRRQPDRFRLEPAWRATGVAMPGNVVCLDAAHGVPVPRILALDGWRTVVELDAAGHEVARHELDLPADAAAGFLRTATDATGRRWWLAVRRGGPRVFVFDPAWRLHATIPGPGSADGVTIGDAELVDVGGDGIPEVVVGLGGRGGLEVATLAGETLSRSLPGVRVAGVACVGRDVVALTADGLLVRAADDAVGPAVDRSGPPLASIASGPVAAGGEQALLAVASPRPGARVAVGIDPASLSRGWTIPLGDGIHRDGPIEPVAWADLLGTPRRQWLVAAADGSVTVAWADGRVVDRYRHGVPLVGIGGYRHAGRGHVVLATREGLEAFTVADVALD